MKWATKELFFKEYYLMGKDYILYDISILIDWIIFLMKFIWEESKEGEL